MYGLWYIIYWIIMYMFGLALMYASSQTYVYQEVFGLAKMLSSGLSWVKIVVV